MTCAFRCLPLRLVRELARVASESGIEPCVLVREAVSLYVDAALEEEHEVVWHGAMLRPGSGTRGELLPSRPEDVV